MEEDKLVASFAPAASGARWWTVSLVLYRVQKLPASSLTLMSTSVITHVHIPVARVSAGPCALDLKQHSSPAILSDSWLDAL